LKGVKILQAGDFHLDSPLVTHSSGFREKRREELLHAVSRLIDHGNRERCDILLIPGDVFDSERVLKSTIEFLSKTFARFHGRIFISPGNHDPIQPGSPYRRHAFPENTHIFEGYEEIHIEDLDLWVCGSGFTERSARRSQLQGIHAPEGTGIKLLIMHGEVTSGSPNEYNPIRTEEIRESGFHYIALGHRHDFSGILTEAGTAYGYAGILEGRGFDELGPKGCIMGTVTLHGNDLGFVPMSRRSYEIRPFDVGILHSNREIAEAIMKEMKKEKASGIFRFILKGEVEGYADISSDMVYEYLRESFEGCEVVDRTSVRIDLKDRSKERNLMGLFFDNIGARLEEEGADRSILEEALRLGARALSQREI
jgi:DNA repair exonuclease SbcCD nuclease subunit